MMMAVKPICLRAISFGSAVQVRKAATSCAICSTVAGVPSLYSTASSQSGGAIAI
jgi:hypothetical protein